VPDNAAYDALTDARTGLISACEPRAIPDHFPASFALTHAVLGDTRRFSPWPSDSAGAGYAFADPGAVYAAAVGEAVERYCGNLVPPGLPVASYDELTAAGRAAADPASFSLYSPQQYATPGFPAAPLSRDRPVSWATGHDLLSGDPVLVPACLVWVSWFASPATIEPLTNPVIQAGLAAGLTWEFAVAGALREVIERDAMTLSWTGGLGLHALVPPRWLAAFARGPRGDLSTRFLAFTSPFGVPVLGALVSDRRTGYLTLGMGVHPDPVRAAVKAFAEALQLQLFAAGYDDPARGYGRIAGQPGSPLKAWRADRRYALSYRPDLSDVIDYGCHLQLHLDPGVQDRFRAELDAATLGEQPLESRGQGSQPGGDDTRALAERLAAAGHRVISVDLTTADVAPLGWRACRVLVPGLYSNSPAGLPFLGGTRLAEAQRHAAVPRPTLPLPH
jgi:ribosomal protein S12 methylthiotransferase accessory factor